jgi:hypothetical protein
MKRINISSGAVWENIVGYSRAVRVGNIVKVAGTTAVEGGVIQFPNQPSGRVKTTIFTVDKAPLPVDNSIKQVDNASLQRRFIKKQREQKPLQGDLVPKQGGFKS